MGTVRLVEVVIKPGSRACAPLATPTAEPGLSCALNPGYAGVEVPRDLHLLLGRGPVEERWFLTSNRAPALDLVWSSEKRFCCEQLFRDQKSGVFRLADSCLREPQRIDGLLLVVAIAVLAGSLQGYALSLAGLRRQVDPHWKRGMSFLRI